MCNFVSWVKKDDKIYFLTDKDLATKEGKELIKYCGRKEDTMGHGAIEHYYGIKGGKHLENEDLSNPDNFPKEIQEVIKEGFMCEFKPEALEVILTPEAWKKYGEIKQSARKKYEEIKQSAWEKYLEIEQSAKKKYGEIKQSAWKKCLEIKQPAWKKCLEIRQSAWEKYEATCAREMRKLIQNPKNRVKGWR